jgi:hypothetical protein
VSRDGNDGPWATFNFDLGSPRQRVRLLPSFVISYVAPVGYIGCSDLVRFNNCSEKRGNVYNPSKSETWAEYPSQNESSPGAASISDEPNGSDTVAIHSQTTVVPIEDQATRVLTDLSDYTGFFGLSPNESSIASNGKKQPSFVKSVLKAVNISTTVWSYTAGNVNSM